MQYIIHSEGRLRITTPMNTFGQQIPSMQIAGGIAMPDNKIGVFDYFIKDHQGNTRMMLTEEIHRELHLCTMEASPTATANYEEHTFGKVNANGSIPADNEVKKTREPVPQDWKCNTSKEVSMLLGKDPFKMVGPSLMLKVMAGDVVDAKTDYYFKEPV